MMEHNEFIELVKQYQSEGGNLNAALPEISAMAATNPGTPYLNLNQWKSSDKPVMKDFNEDNEKIDTGFRTLSEGLAKKSDKTELTQGLNSKVNGTWSIRNSFSAIGITTGSETIASIHKALPNLTMLYLVIGDGCNASLYPIGFGMLEVIRLHTKRTVWKFYSSRVNNFQCWAGVTYEEDNGSVSWSGWKEIT